MIIIFVEFIDQLNDYPINRASLNEYPESKFLWRRKTKIQQFCCKKVLYLQLWYKENEKQLEAVYINITSTYPSPNFGLSLTFLLGFQ